MAIPRQLLIALSLGLCVATACSRIESQDPAPSSRPAQSVPSEFTRFVPIGKDEGKFEVSISTYKNKAGREVSLISSVHVADAKHFADLQREFEKYEVMLYELVASPDQRPKPGDFKGGGGGGLLGMLQNGLKRALDLEFQLHAIDYTPKNFVHADLTPEAFTKKMEERGENYALVFVRLMNQEMRRIQKMRAEQLKEAKEGGKPLGEKEFDLVTAFRQGYGRHTMRLMFAQKLQNVEAMTAGGGSGTVLLEGRNDRAIEVLKEQMDRGKKKLAIYYGAAHMPGIEKTMVEHMGFTKVGERWLVAWDCRKRPDKPPRKKRKGEAQAEPAKGK